MKITKEIVDFKKSLVNNNLIGLALDIDETLSDTSHGWAEKFFQDIGNPENLSPQDFSKKYRTIESAPYFQNQVSKDLIESLAISPSAYLNLKIIEDSNHIVDQINKIIPIVAYITVRPSCVADATNQWIKKHGFPKAPIITRPEGIALKDGSTWKARVLEYLHPQVMGIIDDSPSLVDNLNSNYQGKVFLYRNTQVARKDINVIACPSWASVLGKIKS